MAIPKFFKNLGGVLTEVIAGITTSTGASDADKIPVTGADGRLDNSFMPTGIGQDTQVVITSENLSAGNLVNIYDNAGVVTARKADATTVGKPANGFVAASTTSGQNATIFGIGTNSNLTGLTGGVYWLSTTAGEVVAVAPSGTGNFVQEVGFATAATELWFQPKQGFTLA